jgi:hypothetical protein
MTFLQRSSDNDVYKILSSYASDASSNLEGSILQALVQNLDATSDLSEITYSCPATEIVWKCDTLNTEYVNTSAITNYPPGTVTEKSVILTELKNSDISLNTYTDLDLRPNYNFTSKPSLSYYDANYVFDLSYALSPEEEFDGEYPYTEVKARFNQNDPSFNMQYAVQCRYNTKVNQDTLIDL